MAEPFKKPTKNQIIIEESEQNSMKVKPDEKTAERSKLSLCKRIKLIIENITVEPMLACFIMPSAFASLATQNLNLEKACRVNLAYPQHVCDALSIRDTQNYTEEEKNVQQLVASMTTWKTVLQSAIPALLVIFCGSWSDRWHRRKPCMILPIIGELASVLGLLLCTYFFYELPMEVAGVVEGLIPALGGGWFTMLMAVFSYVADNSSIETRTLRIGIANVFCIFGMPLGTAFSGVVCKAIGFYGVFGASAVMYLVALTYCILRIKEEANKEMPSLIHQPIAFLKDFFNVARLKDTLKVLTKKCDNNRRQTIVLLLIAVMVVIGPIHGEIAVAYLSTRYRFNWDEVDYSMYSTFNLVTGLLGNAFSVGVLSHVLKIHDAFIGIYASTSSILSGFVSGCATTSFLFYFGPIVDILGGSAFTALRSISSKLVEKDELGKLNSVYGACEALMPLLYGPMYSATYSVTMDVMPGAFYVLGSVLMIPALIIFCWMYIQHRRELKIGNKLDVENFKQKETSVGDLILPVAPNELQIGSPILTVYRRTTDIYFANPALEEEK